MPRSPRTAAAVGVAVHGNQVYSARSMALTVVPQDPTGGKAGTR
ncbi:hypothetical protein JIX56_19595 [Streptomyces sp. CA-210063]|nr:hypothetical protein [Streptomyces sp. CA-210063]UUU31926.1 hypothetical protein JIX56_19595 [Streptomyces sp. CA-210063]